MITIMQEEWYIDQTELSTCESCRMFRKEKWEK